jgi:hypothetical protein
VAVSHNKYKASGATKEKAWLIGPKHVHDPAAVKNPYYLKPLSHLLI